MTNTAQKQLQLHDQDLRATFKSFVDQVREINTSLKGKKVRTANRAKTFTVCHIQPDFMWEGFGLKITSQEYEQPIFIHRLSDIEIIGDQS